MTDHTTRDAAEIRASWEDDSERIIRRVHAALNSGRDAAVVQVVLDEVQKAQVDAAPYGGLPAPALHHMIDELRGRVAAYEAALSTPRHCRACGRDVTVQP